MAWLRRHGILSATKVHHESAIVLVTESVIKIDCTILCLT